MSEKIFARVDEQGNIMDYPVFEYVIKARGHTENMYARVDTSDKPADSEYQDVNETLAYNSATNVVKVIYEVTPKGVNYFFNKLTTKVLEPSQDGTLGPDAEGKPYTPTQEDLAFFQSAVIRKVEDGLQQLAQAKGYDNITSLTSYINSSDSHFKSEAAYGENIRSTAYRNLYNFLGKFQAGLETLPTSWDEFVQKAQLPAFNWDNYKEA